jgi:alginate export protein
MRALVLILGMSAFAGVAGADDAPSRLELLEAQVGALQRENRSLQAQVLALSQTATEAAVVAVADAQATPPPVAAASPAATHAAITPTAAGAAPAAKPAPAPASPQVKVGGQLRLRPEHRNRLKPDATGGTSDVFVGQRARANVTVSTERLRAFVEVQDARNWGTEVSTVSNDRNLDLHQAYLDLPDLGHSRVSLTLGRQELVYGDERLLGPADWLTAARSFDGAVVRYGWKGGMVDALGALVNDRKTGARGVGDMVLSGAYGRFLRGKPGRELDLYVLNLTDGAPIAGELTGQDDSRITTTGARARYGKATGPQASAEAAVQFGHRGPDDHEANAFALAAGYIFDVRYKPGIRFEWDRATGDGTPTDGRSREFNNLFPTNHAVYGYADLQGWRNMNAVKGTLTASPRPGHFVSADFLRFRLLDARGAWKDDAGEVLGQDPTGRSGREIGDELDLLYRFPVRKDLTVLLGYSAFLPGRFAESVGRTKTQSYVYSQVLFKF